jgi:hypothetical protein
LNGEEVTFVVINWIANPFRGDKFEAAWAPAAELVTKYGATAWAFTRSKDDPLSFMQFAAFESKLDFERYWYSDEVSEARTNAVGLYQVPLTPVWFRTIGYGTIAETIDRPEAA